MSKQGKQSQPRGRGLPNPPGWATRNPDNLKAWSEKQLYGSYDVSEDASARPANENARDEFLSGFWALVLGLILFSPLIFLAVGIILSAMHISQK